MLLFGGVNVMAIGDSNTYGFGDPVVLTKGTWRYYFGSAILPYLKANPNWVGANPALGTGTAGNKMMGAIGQRIDNIINDYDAANQFLNYRPALAIFLIGINDCNQIYSGAWVGGSISTSIANLSTLLDLYRAAVPNGIAVVPKLFPSTTSGVNDQIVLWNAAMASMVAARSDKDYILVPDLYTAFTNNSSWATDYMFNFLHPNDAGQQVIANTFTQLLSSNVTTMPRATANSRRSIKPHVAALRYTASTATTLGAGVTLDTTQPWAVSFDIDLGRTTSNTNGILTLRTDQATPFVWFTNQSNARYIEFGSSANFDRFFPSGDLRPVMMRGWHNVVVTFDGVNRTLSSSYKLYIDGVNYAITDGSGLGASTDQNAIGAGSGGSTSGTFDMADITIWCGGTAMTAAQVAAWYSSYILPSGPTLIRRYEHKEGSGSTLTDSTGNQNGTIGTAAWITSNLPTVSRTAISVTRSVAVARTLAS